MDEISLFLEGDKYTEISKDKNEDLLDFISNEATDFYKQEFKEALKKGLVIVD